MTKEYEVSKYVLIAVFRKLPDDAILVGVYEDNSLDCYCFVFHSKEWPLMPEGAVIPNHYLTISHEDIKNAKAVILNGEVPDLTGIETVGQEIKREMQKVKAICRCDLAYTGLKTHRKDCRLAK